MTARNSDKTSNDTSTPQKCDVDGCREWAEAIVSWDGGTAYRCGIHVEDWPGEVEWINA